MRSRFTNGNRSPSCLRHSCSILLTDSFGSPSLSRVLWYVISFTIRSSAMPRKSLIVLRAVPASLYALFRLHFLSFRVESTAAYRRWISVRSLPSTFAAVSWFVAAGGSEFCKVRSCCSRVLMRSSLAFNCSLRLVIKALYKCTTLLYFTL